LAPARITRAKEECFHVQKSEIAVMRDASSTRNISLSTLVLSVIAVAAVMYVLRSILVPFMLAGFLTILFKPLVQWFRKKGMPTWVGLIIVLIISSSILWGIFAILATGVDQIIVKAPEYANRVAVIIDQLDRSTGGMVSTYLLTNSGAGSGQFISQSAAVDMVTSSVDSVFSFLSDGVMTILYLIFMVLGGEQFARKLEKAFRNTHVHDLIDVYASVNNKVIRYLRVKTFFSFLTALISWIVMVSFGVDFAALIALFIFILDYLPNIGSAFAVLIPGSVAALQTANVPEALLIMVILTVLQNLIGNVIEPKMMSISLDLSPVVILFSLFFWGWMWGVVGMMLSIPLMAILKAVMEHFPVTKPIAILMGNESPEDAL